MIYKECSYQVSSLYHQHSKYKPPFSSKVLAILKNLLNFEISCGLVHYLAKYPMENVQVNFHTCITKCMILSFICSTNLFSPYISNFFSFEISCDIYIYLKKRCWFTMATQGNETLKKQGRLLLEWGKEIKVLPLNLKTSGGKKMIHLVWNHLFFK